MSLDAFDGALGLWVASKLSSTSCLSILTPSLEHKRSTTCLLFRLVESLNEQPEGCGFDALISRCIGISVGISSYLFTRNCLAPV